MIDSSHTESVIGKYNSMLENNACYFFDVFEFESIIEHFIALGNLDRAFTAYNFAIRQHPNSSSLKIKSAKILFHQKQYDSCLNIINTMGSIEPDNGELFVLKGNIYALKGRLAKAKESYEQAIKMSFENKPEVLYSIAVSLENMGKYEAAAHYFSELVIAEPDNINNLLDLADCLEETGRLYDCIELYKKIINISPYSEIAWHNLGIIYTKLQQWDEAAECFDYSVIIKPEYKAAYLNKADALIHLENYQEAIDTLVEYLDYEHENANVYCIIGECHEKLNRPNLALDYYSRAISLDKSISEAWYGCGFNYKILNDYNTSISHLLKAVSIEKENPDYWFTLAEVYRENGQSIKAIQAFNRVTELDPNDYEAWLEIASIYHEQYDLRNAIGILKKASEYNYDNSLVYYHLARYYYCTGNLKQYYQHFETGLMLDKRGNFYSNFFDLCPEAQDDPKINKLIEQYLYF
jgi:tetratricopeptide (TPR) repeat protein